MEFIHLLAHATEFHDSDTSQVEHTFTSPIVALPLYLGINLAIFLSLRNSKKKSLMLPALMTFNLLIGMLAYTYVPLVSVFAITLGIACTLLVTFSLIASGK